MKYTNLKDLFTAIANAIRGKEGSVGAIVADDFPDRIAAIETQDTTIEDALIDRTISGHYTNNRITKIGEKSFSDTMYLTDVTCQNVSRIRSGAFYQSGVKSVDAPKCKYVEDYAFENSSIERLHIYGGKAGQIFEGAFAHSWLKTLIITGTDGVCAVPILGGAFESTPIAQNYGYIYVHAIVLDAYKERNDWQQNVSLSQIRAIEDYPEITGG